LLLISSANYVHKLIRNLQRYHIVLLPLIPTETFHTLKKHKDLQYRFQIRWTSHFTFRQLWGFICFYSFFQVCNFFYWHHRLYYFWQV